MSLLCLQTLLNYNFKNSEAIIYFNTNFFHQNPLPIFYWQDKKAHESNDGESKKKETVTTGQIRGQNNEIIEYITEDGISYKVSGTLEISYLVLFTNLTKLFLDSAYVATERSDHPYSISTIQEIKPV